MDRPAHTSRQLSVEDLALLPHLVIVKRADGSNKLIEYQPGSENMILAHREAQHVAIAEPGAVVLVAARYREIGR